MSTGRNIILLHRPCLTAFEIDAENLAEKIAGWPDVDEAIEDIKNSFEKAIMEVTSKKLKSMSAGKMGYSTTEVGDLVVDSLK